MPDPALALKNFHSVLHRFSLMVIIAVWIVHMYVVRWCAAHNWQCHARKVVNKHKQKQCKIISIFGRSNTSIIKLVSIDNNNNYMQVVSQEISSDYAVSTPLPVRHTHGVLIWGFVWVYVHVCMSMFALENYRLGFFSYRCLVPMSLSSSINRVYTHIHTHN